MKPLARLELRFEGKPVAVHVRITLLQLACYRVRTLFSTKNSRTFQGLSRTHFSIFLRTQEGHNQAHIMPHQMLKVESAPIFVSDTWEALLDKISNTKFQGLSSTDCNLQGLLRPWIFILKFKNFQGLSRRVRTLMLYYLGYNHTWKSCVSLTDKAFWLGSSRCSGPYAETR